VKRYPAEIADFIERNVSGRSIADLVILINEAFKTDYTHGQIRAYMHNHGLKNGMPTGYRAGQVSKIYPPHIQEFIRENAPGNGPKLMTTLLNNAFGTSYTTGQIDAYYNNHKVSSGLTGRFEKGCVSHNKGKKGYCAPGCEKGWFQKGHDNGKTKPVGSERIDCKDGYVLIKTADSKAYRPKHKVIWEAAYGPVPPGHIITFIDGDKLNVDLSNLRLITMAENAIMNKFSIRGSTAEELDTALLVVKATRIAHRRTKERKKRDRAN
jgi:hypothetical protein